MRQRVGRMLLLCQNNHPKGEGRPVLLAMRGKMRDGSVVLC